MRILRFCAESRVVRVLVPLPNFAAELEMAADAIQRETREEAVSVAFIGRKIGGMFFVADRGNLRTRCLDGRARDYRDQQDRSSRVSHVGFFYEARDCSHGWNIRVSTGMKPHVNEATTSALTSNKPASNGKVPKIAVTAAEEM